MELEGGMMLAVSNTQRFRRLPRGQTLEQGIAEQERLDAAAYRERHEALLEYLEWDDLVMVPVTPGPDAPTAIALDLAISDPGRGWYDDRPPHLDEIRSAIETGAQYANQVTDDSILLIGNFAQISAPRARKPGFEMELAL